MAYPVWSAGTLYQPGDIVVPITAPAPTATAVANGDFSSGSASWDFTGSAFYSEHVSKGGWRTYVELPGNQASGGALNQTKLVVPVGKKITAACLIDQGASAAGATRGWVEIHWFSASDVLLRIDKGNQVDSGAGGAVHRSTCESTCPDGAAYCRAGIELWSVADHNHAIWGGNLWVEGTFAGIPADLAYKAVQPESGFSDASEPAWPPVLGQQVVDNEVIWEAIAATRVVWTAEPLYVSGATEPQWPEVEGGMVKDGTVTLRAVSRRVEDPNCPNTKIVAIAASKVFCGDDDIVRYSATVNPLDWSTDNDAGYLPTGLQNYGSNPVTAMGLYRGNLIVFNAEAFQLWQVDEDPANMALLDALPMGSTEHHAIAPVSNDLFFLASQGVRTVGIAASSTNFQAGDVGMPVDTLVQDFAQSHDKEPAALYFPAMGQYWLMFATGGAQPPEPPPPPPPAQVARMFAVAPANDPVAGTPVRVNQEGVVDTEFDVLVNSGLNLCEAHEVIQSGDYYLFAGNFRIDTSLYNFITTDKFGRIINVLGAQGGGLANYAINTGKGLALTTPDGDRNIINHCGVSPADGRIIQLMSDKEIPWPLSGPDGTFLFSQVSTFFRERVLPSGEIERAFLHIDFPWIGVPQWSVHVMPAYDGWVGPWQRLPDDRAIRGVNSGGDTSVVIYTFMGGAVSSSFFLPGITTPVQAFAIDIPRDWLYFAFALDAAVDAATLWRVGRVGLSDRVLDTEFTFNSIQGEADIPEGYREILGIDVESGSIVVRRKAPQPYVSARPDEQGGFNAEYTFSAPAGSSGCYAVVDARTSEPLTLSTVLADDGTYDPGATSILVYSMTKLGSVGAWSRYELPFATDDWAIAGNSLYLRSGDFIHRLDGSVVGDEVGVPGEVWQFEIVPFPGVIQWPWLEFGQPGVTKMLYGFDIVGQGEVSVSFGIDQSNGGLFTPGYAVPADTVPGMVIPMPLAAPSLSVKLTYDGSEPWQWNALGLYLQDLRGMS